MSNQAESNPILPISDIFYSVQGEGRYAGTPAIFIRTFGCNLACPWCDEPLHRIRRHDMSADEIILAAAQVTDITRCEGVPMIVITGGEPTIHKSLPVLIRRLKNALKAPLIAVESNGYDMRTVAMADPATWITYSPKGDFFLYSHWNELKLVVDTKTDLKPLLEIARNTVRPVYLQPMADGAEIIPENVQFALDAIKKYPFLKLSLQIHKMIGIA